MVTIVISLRECVYACLCLIPPDMRIQYMSKNTRIFIDKKVYVCERACKYTCVKELNKNINKFGYITQLYQADHWPIFRGKNAPR